MAGEFSEDIRLVDDLVPKVMDLRYGFVPMNFKRQSYASSVSRLLKTGEISKNVDEKGKVSLELTSFGDERFKRKFPIFGKNKWDGSFMMVVFDIPEKDKKARQALRNKLKELGFGMMQESVWISPYHFEEDLKEFLDTKGYSSYVFVLKAQKLSGENIKDLVKKIWSLDILENEYKRIIDNKLDLKEAWDSYLLVLSKDPLLPKELFSDGSRTEVLQYLNKMLLIKNKRSINKLQL